VYDALTARRNTLVERSMLRASSTSNTSNARTRRASIRDQRGALAMPGQARCERDERITTFDALCAQPTGLRGIAHTRSIARC
jgi:hypothetical protein